MPDASAGSVNARPRVFVLHSRQPLTTNPAEAFPRDRFEVVVLTDADPATVLREDVEASVEQVVHAGRDEWESVVRSAPAGAAEVVSNDEYCLAECARLRATTGLPARHPAHLDGYLDKVLMKRRLEAAGVPVPRYLSFEPAVTSSRAVADRVVATVGLPAVVKPRREANSRGVEVLADAEAVLGWLARHDGETGWQVDEFVGGPLGHVNALVRQGDVRPVQAGRYLGPLLGLDHGRVLGGWTVPADTPEAVAAHELNGRVVHALGSDGEFVVHTEFATTPDGRLVVLETAARAPGASVSELARVHAGVQLEVAHLRLQAGLPVPEPDPHERAPRRLAVAAGDAGPALGRHSRGRPRPRQRRRGARAPGRTRRQRRHERPSSAPRSSSRTPIPARSRTTSTSCAARRGSAQRKRWVGSRARETTRPSGTKQRTAMTTCVTSRRRRRPRPPSRLESECRRPASEAPLVPGGTSRRRVVQRFTAVQLAASRDVDRGCPRGELLVGHVPRRVRLLRLAPVESSALLLRRECEVADLPPAPRAVAACRSAERSSRLHSPKSTTTLTPSSSARSATVMSRPSITFGCRRRIRWAVERLDPLVLGQAEGLLLEFDAPRLGGLPGSGQSHHQEQNGSGRHHVLLLAVTASSLIDPSGRPPITGDASVPSLPRSPPARRSPECTPR